MRASFFVALVVASVVRAQPRPGIDDCGLERPGDAPLPPPPTKPFEGLGVPVPTVTRELPERLRQGGAPSPRLTFVGALTGKTVYLSAGHGLTATSAGAWTGQRGNTNGIVEDLVSTEVVSQWLVPMMLNVGARVVTARESDLNPNVLFVDNGGPEYTEVGTGFAAGPMGFGLPSWPIAGDVNPLQGGTSRLLNSAASATASATFAFSVPVDGYYSVSTSYQGAMARVPDAHYVVQHAGGESHFRINQTRNGSTWVLLGQFYFRASVPAAVVLQNDSAMRPSGATVSVDAIKVGGGRGLITRGGASTARRADEASRYAAQLNGAPASVYASTGNTIDADRTNDISARTRFAAWDHEMGDDSVYVSWHTNAANATARGTETYAYGTTMGTACTPDAGFTGIAGSWELADFIRQELISDIQSPSGWNEPSWRDRGTRCAAFGELSPTSNPDMPTTILEIAFHDTPADAERLKDPRFRYVAARAIQQGIMRFFARGGPAPQFPPDPPTHVSAVNQASGVLVRWRAARADAIGGGPSSSYRVYSSSDGLAWDDGVPVVGTSALVSSTSGVARFYRISASNSGGESLPSATVGARPPSAGRPLALAVNAFDRFEAALNLTEDMSTFGLGMVERGFVRSMNDLGSLRSSGDALAANDVGFDSATVDAVLAGAHDVARYPLVGWFAGRGHAGGAGPTAAEQALLRAVQGRLLFSGVAGTDSAFLSMVLGAASSSMAGSRNIAGAGVLSSLSLTLDDGALGSFNVGTPPAVSLAGGMSIGTYSSGPLAGAVVADRSAYLAFPFEGISTRDNRVEVMRRLLAVIAPAEFDGGYQPADAGGAMLLDAGSGAGGASGVGGAGGRAGSGGMAAAGGATGGTAGAGAGGAPVDGGAAGRPPVFGFAGGGVRCSAASGSLAALLATWVGRRRRRRFLHR